MSKAKIIQGHSFTISQPFAAGHVLDDAQARALNQVRSENIGNNVREKVKELLAAGNVAEAEALVATRDAEYVFTLAEVSASRKLDPVESEARRLAKEIIKNSLAGKGRKVSQVPEGMTKEDWEAKLESEYERISLLDAVVKEARKNVAAKAKKAEALLEAAGPSEL